MRGPRTLRSRLLFWFLGAIGLAIVTSALVVWTTRPESGVGPEAVAHAVARHIAERLARDWDDEAATRAYAGEVHDVTGAQVHVLRDPQTLPAHVRRAAQHGGVIVPESPGKVLVPIVRDGALVGALELDQFGHRPPPWGWWRLVLAMVLVVAVMSVMAGRVADRLSRPLEQLAHAADRLGAGDLAFRADVARAPHSWVAREVREVAVSFNRMADRVEAMVRGQRELLGAISHELRSPLGRARVALEIARDRLDDRDRTPERSPAHALDDVEKQLGAVDAILGDLLDVTRAGLSDLRKETRSIGEWVRARAADEPPPAIDVRVSPDADAALAFDPALLARALHNLVVNARAHGHPADHPVEIHVSRDGDRVRIVVRDRGRGFPEGFAIDRAFEPFVRGDTSRARPAESAGYGLGLAIVRRIVEAHGGSAFARNAAEGGGAEVGFDLPAGHAGE